MNQLLTLLIVLVVFLIIILAGRKDRVGKADAAKESGKKERDEWAKENVLSAYQVQNKRDELTSTIDKKLGADTPDGGMLKKIVNEWAELKLKRFAERRSWVREPEKKED
tara:strand:+ start:2544 stop:2873 length:330 start_codon:yes stop_codon:yes gene_type:complete